MEPTMNKSETSDIFCVACQISLNSFNYESHVLGRKHNIKQDFYDRNHRTIFVQNVNCTVEDLRNIFEKFGHIRNIVKPESQCYAFIKFDEESSVEASIKANVFIKGKRLIIRKPKAWGQTYPDQIPKNNNDKARKLSETSSGNGSRTDLSPGQIGVEELPVEIPDPTTCPADQSLFEWQARQFVSQVEIPPEMYRDLNHVVCDIERLFHNDLPGCRVLVFGSCSTTLGFRNSDVDLFLQSATDQPENFVRRECRVLFKSRQISILARVPDARVPIIKFVHLPTGWQCDLTANSRLGVCNSRLIRFLISLDPRIRPLMMIVKYWAKVCTFTGSNQYMTTYAVVMLVVFYLQQLSTPVLPPISLLVRLANQKEYSLGWECSFCDQPQKVLSEFHPQENSQSLKELLVGFIKFYKEFDCNCVICPLLGRSIPLADFENPDNLPEEMLQYKNKVKESSKFNFKADTVLRVQDPFELNINITRNVTDKTFFVFKKACLISSDISEAVSEDSLLKGLFSIDSKTLEVEENLFTYKVRLANAGFDTITVSTGRDPVQMYELLTESILLTLRQILKLKVERKSEETSNKVQKLELSTDVHTSPNSSNKTDDLVYICSGNADVCKSRKTPSKFLNILNISLSPFEREVCISNALYQPKEKVVSFKMVIDSLDKFKENDKFLIVKICDPKKKGKSQFNVIGTYLKHMIVILVSQAAMFIKETRDSQSSSVGEVKQSLKNLFDLKLSELPDINRLANNKDDNENRGNSVSQNPTEGELEQRKSRPALNGKSKTLDSNQRHKYSNQGNSSLKGSSSKDKMDVTIVQYSPSSTKITSTYKSQKMLLSAITHEEDCKVAEDTVNKIECDRVKSATKENLSVSPESEKGQKNPFLTSIEKLATEAVEVVENTKSSIYNSKKSMEKKNTDAKSNLCADNIYPDKMDEGAVATAKLDSKSSAKSDCSVKQPHSSAVPRKPKVYIERPSKFRKPPGYKNVHPRPEALKNGVQDNPAISGVRDLSNSNPGYIDRSEYGQRQLSKSTDMHKMWFPTLFKQKK